MLNFAFAQKSNQKEIAEIRKTINNAVEEFSKTNYDKALALSKHALVNSFAINDNLFIAQSYNTIGVIYDECGESDKAIEIYNKALKYAKYANNDLLYNWIYSNLGSVYYYNNVDVNKGISYYKEALKYAEIIKDSNQIIKTKLNLSSAYFAIENLKEGNLLLSSIKKSPLIDSIPNSNIIINNLLGINATKNNNKQLAEKYYANSLKLAKSANNHQYILNTFENLFNHFSHFKDTKNANLYKNRLDSINKIIYTDEKLDKFKKESIQIELDENKITFDKIEKENIQNQKIIKESKLVVFLFIIGVITLCILLLVLYKNIKYREKANLELKKAYEELKIAKEKAEEAAKIKSQFVSTITHELRTPLYGVIGITNIILDEHKELNNSPHLKSLKFSAKYLLALVNDILQINKIEEKKIELDKVIFNLSDEISTIYNSVEYIADKNKNKLVVEIDTEIPEYLIGDKLRLSQILMNLVSNALKFTKNGEVSIIVELKEIRGSIYTVQFYVKDTGIGISKENQEKIFDKFVQIERRDGDYQGTGLGLSIVSSLIELFNSKIHLESEENVGTTFSFAIDFEYDQQKCTEIINNIEVDISSDVVYNILVVEDNKINQVVTKKILENSNMQCTIVDDGYAAIVALDREEFDLVLMDINMPLINGFDTSRKIREKGITIPIIALTAFDKQEVINEVMESGMNDILIKPFELNKLQQLINKLLPKN